jgi:putative membrane protein insertion efficiency factor
LVRGLVWLLLIAGTASAGVRADLAFITSRNRPDSVPPPEKTSFTFQEVNEAKMSAMGIVRLYQLFISSQDQSVCNFTPSCSRFGMAAIKRYGLFAGGLMTTDRLLRCNGIGNRYYPVNPQTGKCSDLPENDLPWERRE